MIDESTFTVIGPGSLGSVLMDLIRTKDKGSLKSVWGRSKSDCRVFVDGDFHPAKKPFPNRDDDLGNYIFITTPDSRIQETAEKLSQISIDWKNYNVVHFSGSYDSSILSPLAKKGARTASMHPLQTFTNGDILSRLNGIWFTLEGDDDLLNRLQEFAKEAGARSVRLDGSQKRTMHLAAVFASNYLVGLMNVVENLSASNGIDNGLELLKPIIRQTLENIFEKGAGNSLTGPIARGDSDVVSQHIDDLNDRADDQLLYRQLGLEVLRIAERNGRLSEEEAEQIKKILEDGYGSRKD